MRLISFGIILFLALSSPRSATAQQFVIDDARTVGFGACQLEAWVGEEEGWILPACEFVQDMETTVGTAFFDRGTGSRAAHLMLEAKTFFGLDEAFPGTGTGGFVAGVALPLEERGGNGVGQAYTYLPLTAELEGFRTLLHGNLGWSFEKELLPSGTENRHGLLWGIRADIELVARLEAITELFGVTGDGSEIQVGLRVELVADRLMIDVSRGFHLSDGEDGLGYQLGFAWTPPAFR